MLHHYIYSDSNQLSPTTIRVPVTFKHFQVLARLGRAPVSYKLCLKTEGHIHLLLLRVSSYTMTSKQAQNSFSTRMTISLKMMLQRRRA